MLTILGGLLGLLTSALPEIFRTLRTWQDQRHELRVMELQIEAQRAVATLRLDEVRVQGDIAEAQALAAEQLAAIRAQAPTGIGWVDALSASVRPMVTYLFVLGYLAAKAAQYRLGLADGAGWAAVAAGLWSEADMAVFMAVISYWFGARAFARHRQGAN